MPLVVGSEPSVVYVISLTPEPPSLAESVTETGLEVYQPGEHALPLHWMLVLGAVPSAVTVNELALLWL